MKRAWEGIKSALGWDTCRHEDQALYGVFISIGAIWLSFHHGDVGVPGSYVFDFIGGMATRSLLVWGKRFWTHNTGRTIRIIIDHGDDDGGGGDEKPLVAAPKMPPDDPERMETN